MVIIFLKTKKLIWVNYLTESLWIDDKSNIEWEGIGLNSLETFDSMLYLSNTSCN